MNFGSLFSGIGGIDLGLERAGMTCIWQVEIDDYCLRTLNKIWPSVPKYGNVRDVGRHNLESVDLIAGGFPCQPHSVAGKRRGAEDDRNLWPEFSRIIAELRPRYVLAENVPGIITTYLDTVLSDLESQGYTCATFNIPACAFDAPHRRERIFIVAYSDRTRELQPRGGKRTQRRRTSNESKDVADTESRENDERRRGDLAGASRERGCGNASVGVGSEDVPDASPLQRSKIKRDEQNGILSEVLPNSEGQRRGNRTMRGNGIAGHATNIEKRWTDHGRRTEGDAVRSWWSVEPRLGELVDGLSPELAGRFIRVAKGCPDRVNKLKALGNAVVPVVAQWIGQRIIEFDERLDS